MQFKLLYKEGFFPGLNETEEDFYTRVKKVKSLAQEPKSFLESVPLKIKHLTPILPSFFQIERIKPLPFWYGGMTYIVELTPKIHIPFLQIPKRSLFHLDRNEILSHEKVHALRVMYHEPKFEEILAFRTSKSHLRRILSPIFGSTVESSAFLLLLLPLPVSPLPFLCNAAPLLLMLAYSSVRLIFRHFAIHKCLKTLKKITTKPEEMLFCLTDKEIISFAKGKDTFQGTSFRIQCLNELFIDM